ncbi:MAG TPA: hypothetical protein VFI47_21575 [Acidimicrobiales bacterium]|nr:hypothetical protein [Acidimicrobiales bacterium]
MQRSVRARSAAGAGGLDLPTGRRAGRRPGASATAVARTLAGSADAGTVLDLQRTAGNRAVAQALTRHPPGAVVELRPEGVEHPAAASLGRADTRFRLPTFADLKAAYKDPTLKIPAAVIQSRVAQLLGRMAREKRLKSKDPVADIVKKIFPAPGVISEAEFRKAIDAADRTAIYRSVLDADTKVKKVDRAKLKAAIKASADIVKQVEGDATGLKEVFGSKDAVAKANYARARAALGEVSRDMDTKISTDYNLDDPEVFLGGWASHGVRHMHLLVEVVKVIDPAESKVTLIHEASHLSDPSVDDHGYYGTPGFEALDEATKVGNAGHYEELPRRKLGASSFVGMTFTPGVKKGGGAITWEDTINRQASEHMRKAWDAAVDTHTWLRGVRKAWLKGSKAPFDANKALILEASKLMDLTVHEQAPGKARITSLDVTLTESIARAMMLISELTGRETPVHPMGPWLNPGDEDKAAKANLIDAAIGKYGNLLGDRARDWALIDWMVAHYRSLP